MESFKEETIWCECEKVQTKKWWSFSQNHDNRCQKCDKDIQCNWCDHSAQVMDILSDVTKLKSEYINLCKKCYAEYVAFNRDINRYRY